MNNVIIRSELLNDYHGISLVNAITFNYSFGMGEAPLTSTLRSRAEFDRELSLVAEYEGEIIGHALFSPQQLNLNGEVVKAVILGPLAVLPQHQNQGIGTQLIVEGHKRSKEKGYHASMLMGHPNYYPRFGYKPMMFGSSQIQIPLKGIPSISQSIYERRIETADLDELHLMWKIWFNESNFSLIPSTSITDWISHSKGIQASACVVNEQLSGYLRYDKHTKKMLCILAKDADSLISICSYLKSTNIVDNEEFLSLPLPNSTTELMKLTSKFDAEFLTGPACMLKILDEDNKPITTYCNDVELGKCKPGHVIWPVEFDIC